MVAYSSMGWYRGTHHVCRDLRRYPHSYHHSGTSRNRVTCKEIASELSLLILCFYDMQFVTEHLCHVSGELPVLRQKYFQIAV